MKLLLKQYLTSLNERGELDAILPDFLSESGFKVTYRAQRGNREYGVDVAAVGVDPKTGQTTLFLLSIKAGDLKRRDWDSGDQSLRASLNEIIDFYIPKRIPKHLKALPIKIALCFGGDIQGNIRDVVESYIDEHTQEGVIDFEEWNGDHIVGLIAGGILRESIFPKPIQTDLRKALAFVDEPSVCVAHFQRVLTHLERQNFKRKRDRLTAMRQIYLVVWNIYVWGRDADNLEAAHQCSERALLWTWDMCKDHIGAKSVVAREQTQAINKLARLVQIINTAYITEHILPYSHSQNALSSSVASRFSLDINLKLFDVLGRVALNGLWFMSSRQQMPYDTSKEIKDQLDVQIEELAQLILRMMSLNSVYNSPIRDDHAIETTLVGIFLRASGHHQILAKWIEQIYLSCKFEFTVGDSYPCILTEYAELAVHPQNTEGYKEEVTTGSVLYPILAIWFSIIGNEPALKSIATFQKEEMSHSTWQIWFLSSDSEQHLYKNSALHGASFLDLDLHQGTDKLLDQLSREIEASDSFKNLSAIKYGILPMVLMACRHYRLPIPPQYWTINFGADDKNNHNN